MERFWEKVEKTDDCWEWQACTVTAGYGQISVDGEMVYAHRLSYELEYEDPGDEQVNHHCDNPSCVNPEHLYAGDQTENVEDAFERDRRDNSGENHPQSRLTKSDVEEIRDRVGDESQAELAREFDVSTSHLNDIVHERVWA